MWKRSPDRKAPARKPAARAPVVRSVTRSRVSIDPEPSYQDDEKLSDFVEPSSQKTLMSDYIPPRSQPKDSEEDVEDFEYPVAPVRKQVKAKSQDELSSGRSRSQEEVPTLDNFTEEEESMPPPPEPEEREYKTHETIEDELEEDLKFVEQMEAEARVSSDLKRESSFPVRQPERPKSQDPLAPASLKAEPRSERNVREAEPMPAEAIKTKARPQAQPQAPQRVESGKSEIGKTNFLRLIKAAGVPSANANVMEAVREIVPDFFNRICDTFLPNEQTVDINKVNQIISRYIRDEEKELIQEASLTTSQFQGLIADVCASRGLVCKRDAIYMLHLFLESMIHKFLQGADMIAEANRRQRIDAKDVSVAYMIYTM